MDKQDEKDARAEKTYEKDIEKLEETLRVKLNALERMDIGSANYEKSLAQVEQAEKRIYNREVRQSEIALRCAVNPDLLRVQNLICEDNLHVAQARWYEETGLMRVAECHALMKRYIKWSHENAPRSGRELEALPEVAWPARKDSTDRVN